MPSNPLRCLLPLSLLSLGCGSDTPTSEAKSNSGSTQEAAAAPGTGESADANLFTTHGGEWAAIEPGTFVIGSPEDEKGRHQDETQHTVTLTRAYQVSKTEVTQGLWEAVMPSRPWAEKERRTDPDEVDRVGICDSVGNQAYGSDQPAYCMTWEEAIQFCNKLSEADGLTPVYTRRSGRDVEWNQEANGYRLLTEAEWEYAARAGTTSLYSGGGIGNLGEVAWHGGNSNEKSHSVATRKPNAWGLYDMTGNVAEWTWDWYVPFVDVPSSDPTGGALGMQNGRVIRTSSFRFQDRHNDYPQESDRVAARTLMRFDWASDWLGFRIARSSIDL